MQQNDADRVDVRVAFPVRASVLVMILAVGLSGLYYWLTKSPKESLVFFGAAVGAAGAALAAIYAAKTLNLQVRQLAEASAEHTAHLRHERRVAALVYAARWNEPHMEQARAACREVLLMKGSGVKDITAGLVEAERELHVIHVLNFLEEVATAIHHDVADSDVLKSVYRDAVVLVWRCMGEWALTYRSERGQPGAWTNLEALFKAWS